MIVISLQLREIECDNLNGFIGLSLDSNMPTSVWQYASRSSLQDLLHNISIKLDWYFKYSLIRDLVNGMCYLHESDLKSFGYLKSTNCVVNSRWVLLVTDYGLPFMRQAQDIEPKGLFVKYFNDVCVNRSSMDCTRTFTC